MDTKSYTNDAVKLLKELIAIPSISRNETLAADKLASYLDLWQLPYGREGNNLWVGCQDWDNNRKTVMLNAHIDTVKPVSTWSRDPFTPSQEGDLLYGLGRRGGLWRRWFQSCAASVATRRCGHHRRTHRHAACHS